MARGRNDQKSGDIDLQTAKLAALGQMSAGVAHEINSPLAVVGASTRIILDNLKRLEAGEKVDAKNLIEKCEMIQKSLKRISTIISGLKKFSRFENQTNISKHDFIKILSEVEALIHLTSLFSEVKIKINNQLGPSFEVDCDDVEIEQVLFNLVNNAIDAAVNSKDKTVTVNVSAKDDNLYVDIEDTGPGFSEDSERNMFSPFYTTKPVGKGTGLGLSISKGIIENHNGKLYLNKKSKLTCMSFFIPIVQK